MSIDRRITAVLVTTVAAGLCVLSSACSSEVSEPNPALEPDPQAQPPRGSNDRIRLRIPGPRRGLWVPRIHPILDAGASATEGSGQGAPPEGTGAGAPAEPATATSPRGWTTNDAGLLVWNPGPLESPTDPAQVPTELPPSTPGETVPGPLPGPQLPGAQLPGTPMPGTQLPGAELPQMGLPGSQLPGMPLQFQMPGALPGMGRIGRPGMRLSPEAAPTGF